MYEFRVSSNQTRMYVDNCQVASQKVTTFNAQLIVNMPFLDVFTFTQSINNQPKFIFIITLQFETLQIASEMA